MRPKFLGQAAAARLALQLRKSAQRLLSIQHLTASRALAPAFDQRQPRRVRAIASTWMLQSYVPLLFQSLKGASTPPHLSEQRGSARILVNLDGRLTRGARAMYIQPHQSETRKQVMNNIGTNKTCRIFLITIGIQTSVTRIG